MQRHSYKPREHKMNQELIDRLFTTMAIQFFQTVKFQNGGKENEKEN